MTRFAHIARHHPPANVPELFYHACYRSNRYSLAAEVARAGGFWRVYNEAVGRTKTQGDINAKNYAEVRRMADRDTITPVRKQPAKNARVDRHAKPIEAHPFLNIQSPKIQRIWENPEGARVELHRTSTCWRWYYFKPKNPARYWATDIIAGLLEFDTLVESGAFGRRMRLTFPILTRDRS